MNSGDVARVLTLLTAWGRTDSALLSRTTMPQTEPRRRLLAGLAAARSPGRVSWLPGYRPVECRIVRGAPTPYAAVKNAISESVEMFEVETAMSGALVIGLAIAHPPRGRA